MFLHCVMSAEARECATVRAVAYLMIGCVGYYRLGSDFDKSKPVTSVLPQDLWTSLANVGLLAHCIIAYMVRCCMCKSSPISV